MSAGRKQHHWIMVLFGSRRHPPACRREKVQERSRWREKLLARHQADVILEAVDERMDKKLDEKFNPVITKLDAVLKKSKTIATKI